jgi:hypothetical protein
MSDDQPQAGVQIEYDEQAQEWRLISTGEALAPELIHAEIRNHALLSSTMFDSMTTQLYEGVLSIDEWQNATFAELKEGHTANAMFAAGTSDLSPEALARLEATIQKEANFLADFAQGIADGDVSELQARARAKQYAQAMEQSYWDEWRADIANTPEFSHLPILSQSPGDGGTQCRGNCQCILEFTDAGINWLLFPAEHCPDCEALAAGGPYRSA